MTQMEIKLEQEQEMSLDLVEKLEEEGEVLRNTMENLENHGSVMATINQRKSYMTSAIEAMEKQTEFRKQSSISRMKQRKNGCSRWHMTLRTKKRIFLIMMNWDNEKRQALVAAFEALTNAPPPTMSTLNNQMTEQYIVTAFCKHKSEHSIHLSKHNELTPCNIVHYIPFSVLYLIGGHSSDRLVITAQPLVNICPRLLTMTVFRTSRF